MENWHVQCMLYHTCFVINFHQMLEGPVLFILVVISMDFNAEMLRKRYCLKCCRLPLAANQNWSPLGSSYHSKLL